MEWAVLLMAYGGPDSLDDIEPYLLDVRGGRETPKELVEQIRQRYAQIGGRSPLLEITRMQAAALQETLNTTNGGNHYKVFVGMRHWTPFIRETVGTIVAEGYERLVTLCMTPFASKMSTGAYHEKLVSAIQAEGVSEVMDVREVDCWYENSRFIQAVEKKVRAGLAKFSEDERDRTRVIFTAHSLPAALTAQGDPYAVQFRQTAALAAEALQLPATQWMIGYQSAGAQNTRWLGPSLEEVLEARCEAGDAVLVVPVGFVADHVEILYDVDIEAQALAKRLGIHLERTESQNASSEFIGALANVVEEAVHAEELKPSP